MRALKFGNNRYYIMMIVREYFGVCLIQREIKFKFYTIL